MRRSGSSKGRGKPTVSTATHVAPDRLALGARVRAGEPGLAQTGIITQANETKIPRIQQRTACQESPRGEGGRDQRGNNQSDPGLVDDLRRGCSGFLRHQLQRWLRLGTRGGEDGRRDGHYWGELRARGSMREWDGAPAAEMDSGHEQHTGLVGWSSSGAGVHEWAGAADKSWHGLEREGRTMTKLMRRLIPCSRGARPSTWTRRFA